jgi:hypothetical protein
MATKKAPIQPPKQPVVKTPIPGKPTSMPGGTAPQMIIRDSLDRKIQKK